MPAWAAAPGRPGAEVETAKPVGDVLISSSEPALLLSPSSSILNSSIVAEGKFSKMKDLEQS
jgi:hypothetical protein